jgi:preprotein translocase subunit SecD
MRRLLLLIGIVLAVLSGSGGPAIAHQVEIEVETKLLLVLQAEPASDAAVDPDQLAATALTIEQRIDALGITDAEVWLSDGDQIVGELPGVNGDQADRVGQALTASALLEIIDPQGEFLQNGTVVATSLGGPTDGATPAAETVYATVITGEDVKEARATTNQVGSPVVEFTLTDEAAERFYEYTSAHIGQPLSIVLNKRVVSSPVVNSAIRDQGLIEGLTEEEVADLVLQLNTGTLQVPLRVVTSMVLTGIPAPEGTPVPEALMPDVVAPIVASDGGAGYYVADEPVTLETVTIQES